MEESTNQSNTRKHIRSIFWPLTLIAIGVIFLLSNTNVIQMDFWGLLSTYWPLIFVIGSLDDVFQGKDLPGAVIGIGFGALLTAGNLGYLPWDAFQLLFRLWPVLIVSIGLNLLFANRTLLLNVIGVLLAIGVVLALVLLSMGQIPAPAQASQPFSIPLDGAVEGQINLNVPVGPIAVRAGSSDQFASGSYSLLKNENILQDYAVNNKRGTLDISTRGNNGMVYPVLNSLPRWDMQINPGIPMELNLKLAVGDIKADLTGLNVSKLTLEEAVGLIDVTLPANQKLMGEITNPVGRILLRVPRGASVYIRGDIVMTLVSKPSDWTRSNGIIASPGATSAADITLEINQPVGILTIQTIP